MDTDGLIHRILGNSNTNRASDMRYEETVVIAFTPRSGSTALTDALARMGLAKSVKEIFNPRGPFQKLHQLYGGSDLAEYLNSIYENMMSSERLLFKTNFWDFKPVFELGSLDRFFPSMRVIYIERIDKVMQAVSLYRAIHSGDWHQMGSSSQLSLIQEIDFDLEKILFHIRKLESQCNAWEEFFLSKEIIPHRIYYEEFDEYPDKVLRDSYKFICRDDYEGKIDIQHSKMRDALSEHWAERVRCYLNESV